MGEIFRIAWERFKIITALISDADHTRTSVTALGPTRLSDFDWSRAPKVGLVTSPPKR